MFRRNVGGIDRVLRLAVGAVSLSIGIALLATGRGGWLLTVVGALILTSGVLGFCPPYVLLGISTARSSARACPGAPPVEARRG